MPPRSHTCCDSALRGEVMSRSVCWRPRLTFTLHSRLLPTPTFHHFELLFLDLPCCGRWSVGLIPLTLQVAPSGVENTCCNSVSQEGVIAIWGDRGFRTRTVSTKRIGARRCGGALERSMSCVCEPVETSVSLAMTHIRRLRGLSVRWSTDDTHRLASIGARGK